MDQTQNTPAKELTAKQQVVDSLKKASNVLVTVSTNPSVDQLAACIGLTLMLNKLDKHGTAVFSGEVPSTLSFLQPEKTLETNTDSLRDFIISLDKSKADKLRYKVEDDVVRIYITPYRTSISDADLEFTQGDFNVDVVVALGVDNKEHLDQAILDHGRILHDAVVIGLSCGPNTLDVGSINWHEPAASSLSEMIVSISEAFKTGLLDTQMSTAFLTGIVAETERFSNDRTTPKVMTLSAQLMAAGANQQLIASQLSLAPMQQEPELLPEPEEVIPAEPIVAPAEVATETPIVEEPGLLRVDQEPPVEVVGSTEEISLQDQPVQSEAPQAVEQGSGESSLSYTMREEDHTVVPVAEVVKSLGTSGDIVVGDEEEEPSEELKTPEIEIDDKGKLVDLEAEEEDRVSHRQKVIQPLSSPKDEAPKTDLSSYVFEPPANGGTLTANSVPEHEQPDVSVDPLSESKNDAPILSHDTTDPAPELSAAPVADESEEISTEPVPEKTLADLEVAVDSPHLKDSAEEARNAVESAATSEVLNPADTVPEEQTDENSPPSLPPPFMPPLPTTGTNGELNLPTPQN